MYLPKHFEVTDAGRIHALVDACPLATLVHTVDGALTADPVPLELDPEVGPHGVLRGHVARANALARGADGEVLAIFHGPDSYVSPAWYPSKQAHGRVVPTWNYAVVHAAGTLRAIDDPAWLRPLLERLTDRFERERPEPWAVADAPEAFIDAHLRAVVGIEIAITRLAGKWKSSQNRDRADREGVAAGLAAECRFDAATRAHLVRIDGD